MIKYSRVEQTLRFLMENQTQKKTFVHYDHADACKYSRWTARESYQFMYARPWKQVLDFYSNVVRGQSSLPALFESEVDW